MCDNRLTLANEKETETILLTGTRIPKVINIKIDNYNLKKKNIIKYFGIEIDNSRKFIIHIEKVYTKVDTVTRS